MLLNRLSRGWKSLRTRRGAMGITYRATDKSLQRKVALKIIKTDIAERSTDARERFVREARAAAALRHENIAVIHQFGMRLETGQYFYAMELIEGETLDDRVRRTGRSMRVPPSELHSKSLQPWLLQKNTG